MTWDPDAARERSVAELERFGLRVNPHLPVLGEDEVGRLRPVEEVVARCRALFAVLAAVEGEDPEGMRASLEARGLMRWVGSEEKAYLDTLDESRCVQLTWRTEGMLALGWSLGLFDELPLTGNAAGIADAFGPIDPFGEDPCPADVALRPREELAARLDVFYCAHWCVRHHELEGEPDPWPEEIEQGVVWERRHGLEFLFWLEDDDWDQITLDT